MIEESEIGKRLKQLRIGRGLSLRELASRTGFSKGYLSKLENSDKAPPVSTLITVAQAFNTNVSSLFAEHEHQEKICVVRAHERQKIARDGTVFGYSYEGLADRIDNKHMEPYILKLSPRGSSSNQTFSHKGEELLFVLSGKMEFHYRDLKYVLEEGDCVYFDCGTPHYGEAVDDEEVTCFMVVHAGA